MPFQITVCEIKPARSAADLTSIVAGGAGTITEQVYEQTVDVLDLNKVIAAVNFKPRVRKARTPAAQK